MSINDTVVEGPNPKDWMVTPDRMKELVEKTIKVNAEITAMAICEILESDDNYKHAITLANHEMGFHLVEIDKKLSDPMKQAISNLFTDAGWTDVQFNEVTNGSDKPMTKLTLVFK